MKILKSPFFYLTLFLCFCIIMAIRQRIDDNKNYHTIVNVTYQDNKKNVYEIVGRPDISLNKGELSANGIVISSYVKSFDWNVYKNKLDK